jgi:hypothetical protein
MVHKSDPHDLEREAAVLFSDPSLDCGDHRPTGLARKSLDNECVAFGSFRSDSSEHDLSRFSASLTLDILAEPGGQISPT